MSKDSSAKYYQNNNERQQNKAHERCQSLSKEKKKKQQYGLKDTKICQKMKNKSFLSIEEILQNEKKNASL